MTDPDEMANDAAGKESPLRHLFLTIAADVLDMGIAGASCDEIVDYLDAACTAAEKRLFVEAILSAASRSVPLHLVWSNA